MKVAFATWEGRISPVFDASKKMTVLEVKNGEIISRDSGVKLPDYPLQKVKKLIDLRAQTLVCGAISRPVANFAAASGIKVFPFTAGNLEEVIKAFMEGTLSDPTLSMPGCCRHRGRHGRRAIKYVSPAFVVPCFYVGIPCSY